MDAPLHDGDTDDKHNDNKVNDDMEDDDKREESVPSLQYIVNPFNGTGVWQDGLWHPLIRRKSVLHVFILQSNLLIQKKKPMVMLSPTGSVILLISGVMRSCQVLWLCRPIPYHHLHSSVMLMQRL